MKKIKIIYIAILYVLLIVVQICSFTPYTKVKTYVSAQNVPHSVVLERGWKGIDKIKNYEHHKEGLDKTSFEIEQVNITLAIIQFLLTTSIPICLLIALKRKSNKNIEINKGNDKPSDTSNPKSCVDTKSEMCQSADEYVTFHILSFAKGYIQDVIKVTPENKELLNKELNKKTNSIYCYELSVDDTPHYTFITKEDFDLLLPSFQENQKQLLFNHTCSRCGKTFKVKYNMPKGQTTIPNLSVICPQCKSKEDINF